MMPHAWFNEARFGMFVHWGPYSVAGRGEWVVNRELIPKEEYRDLCASQFTAENYDPGVWAGLAKAAGMKYVVLTTRHHDGFSLWPTAADDFHSGNFGAKRDLVGPFVQAVRDAGLKVGLYYSPANWFHPDYPGSQFRDWPEPEDWKSAEHRERFIRYYRSQIRELLTGYGPIDYIWFDGCIPSDLQSREVNEEILRLQPHILINNRNGPPCHVTISEQVIRAAPEGHLWESCMTLNGNWGYHSGDHNWKSPLQVVQMLTETASQAGNLLLNVGPMADGTIPSESVDILREVGAWLSRHGSAIYGSERSPFSWNNHGRLTVSGEKIFFHIWNHPGPKLCLAEIRNPVKSVRFLDGNHPIRFSQQGNRLFLENLPESLPDPIATTLVIEVEGKPTPVTSQTTHWIPE